MSSVLVKQKYDEMKELLKTQEAQKEIQILNEYFEKIRKKWLPKLSQKDIDRDISFSVMNYDTKNVRIEKYDEHSYIVGLTLKLPNFIRTLGTDYKNIFYEEIRNGVTMSEYVKKCNVDEFLNIYTKILKALELSFSVIDFTHYSLDTDKVIISNGVPIITDFSRSHIKIGDDIFGYGGSDSFLYNADPLKSSPLYDPYKLLCYSLYYMKEYNIGVYDKCKDILKFFNVDESADSIIKNQKECMYYLLGDDRKIETLINYMKTNYKVEVSLSLSPVTFEELYHIKTLYNCNLNTIVASFPYKDAYKKFHAEYYNTLKECYDGLDGLIIFPIKYYSRDLILKYEDRYKHNVNKIYHLYYLLRVIIKYNKIYTTVNLSYEEIDEVDKGNFEMILSKSRSVFDEVVKSLSEDSIRLTQLNIRSDYYNIVFPRILNALTV